MFFEHRLKKLHSEINDKKHKKLNENIPPIMEEYQKIPSFNDVSSKASQQSQVPQMKNVSHTDSRDSFFKGRHAHSHVMTKGTEFHLV